MDLALIALRGAPLAGAAVRWDPRDPRHGCYRIRPQPPKNLWHYGAADNVPALGAAYLVGLARQQGFLDGHKRTALAAALTFLHVNGHDFDCPFDEVFAMTHAVATNQVAEEQVVVWVGQRVRQRSN